VPHQKYRLILVDDHPAMRESIAAAVEDFYPRRLEVVAQCGDGISAVEQAKRARPELVLLDLGLPGKHGLQVLSEIRAACPGVRLIVFSMHDDQAHVVDAVRAGADDYLFKGSLGAKEVVDHVAQWLERESEKPDRLRNHVFAALRGLVADRVARGLPSLTPTEIRGVGIGGLSGVVDERDRPGFERRTGVPFRTDCPQTFGEYLRKTGRSESGARRLFGY
jgi:DNA-binding NarL/FixJ family response regulator